MKEAGEMTNHPGELMNHQGELEEGEKRSKQRHTWCCWASWVGNSNEQQSFLSCLVSCETWRVCVLVGAVKLNQTTQCERRVLLELCSTSLD